MRKAKITKVGTATRNAKTFRDWHFTGGNSAGIDERANRFAGYRPWELQLIAAFPWLRHVLRFAP